MRRRIMVLTLICALLTAVAAVGPAQQPGDLRLNLTVTWDMGLRVGLDYRISERLGVQADLGTSLFILEGAFILTGDVFAVYHVLQPDQPFQFRAMIGIPDWRTIFIRPVAGEIAVGASLEAGYEFDGPWGAFLRVGAGVPFFAEDGEFGRREIGFPLGLWPDISAGAKWTYRGPNTE